MKLNKLNCPNCGGRLDMKINNNTSSIYCPYCGQPFRVDSEKNEFTYNKNVNIHKRYTDDAAIVREINKDRKDKRDNRMFIVCMVMVMGVIVVLSMLMNLHEKKEISKGRISAIQLLEYLIFAFS